jgi:hypothetical protein
MEGGTGVDACGGVRALVRSSPLCASARGGKEKEVGPPPPPHPPGEGENGEGGRAGGRAHGRPLFFDRRPLNKEAQRSMMVRESIPMFARNSVLSSFLTNFYCKKRSIVFFH